MTEDVQEAKINAMEMDIKEIKSDIKVMPDIIVSKVNESVDMKIKLATSEMEKKLSETEKKYQSKLIALLLGLIGEGVGLAISFFKG